MIELSSGAWAVAGRGWALGMAVIAAAFVAGAPVIDAAHADPGLTLLWQRQEAMWGYGYVTAVAADAAGNVAVIGPTTGSFAGMPGKGRSDAFVTVRAPNGTQRWSYLLGTTGSENPLGVAIGAGGAVAVAGNTTGSFAQPNKGLSDAFVVKFTPEGAVSWRRQAGTRQNEQVGGVAMDRAGNVVVVGRTMGPLAGRVKGIEDAFVIAYTADGTQRWRRLFGTADDDTANAVTIDAAGNIAIVGATWGSLARPNGGYSDAFVVVYGPDGAPRWRRQIGVAGSEQFSAVTTDTAGNIVAAGYVHGGDPDNWDVLVAKYTSDGAPLWTRRLGTAAFAEYAINVLFDPARDHFIVVYQQDGGYPSTLAVYSADGTLLQTQPLSIDPDEGTVDDIMAMDAAGNIYAAGVHNPPPNYEEFFLAIWKYAPLAP